MISLPYNIVTNLLLGAIKPEVDCSPHLLMISLPYNILNILINLLLGAMKPEEDCHQGNFVNLQMLSSAFVWVVLVGVTFAPFPPEHQYNFLNPVIDPW